MRHIKYLTATLLLISQVAFAHTGEGGADTLSRWIGNYHYIFVHFPIVLILMACVAELILVGTKKQEMHEVVNFLLISAAIFVFPTAFSGLALEESGVVGPAYYSILAWHEFLGFFILSLTLVTVLLRYWLGNKGLYFLCLFVLGISVITTSHLGGLMAFEGFTLLPPFLHV